MKVVVAEVKLEDSALLQVLGNVGQRNSVAQDRSVLGSWKLKLKKVEKSWKKLKKSWKRVEKQKVEIRFDSRLDGSFDLDKKMIFNVLILTITLPKLELTGLAI
jgi:hypothetical protein